MLMQMYTMPIDTAAIFCQLTHNPADAGSIQLVEISTGSVIH